MNPSDEAPESHVNGQTSQVRPSSSATVKAKPRPKKGNLSPASKFFNVIFRCAQILVKFGMI